jgi:hypothetical protein
MFAKLTAQIYLWGYSTLYNDQKEATDYLSKILTQTLSLKTTLTYGDTHDLSLVYT